MITSNEGIKLIQQFEGLRLKAYQDSVGVWTIGYGHTLNVKPGDVITQTQAVEFLKQDIQHVEKALNKFTGFNQHQFDALVSFFFNVGTGWITKGGFDKLFISQKWDEIPAKLAKYVYAGGQILQGLINRRRAEIEHFKKKVQL